MRKLVIDALIAVIVVGLFVYSLVDYGESERVVCDRVTNRPRCTVVVDGVVSSSTTVYGDLAGVRVIDHETLRGGHWYGVGLKDRAGTEQEVATSIPEEDAQRMEKWFVDGERRVEVVRGAFSGNVIIFIVTLALVSLLMIWSALRQWRDFRTGRSRAPHTTT